MKNPDVLVSNQQETIEAEAGPEKEWTCSRCREEVVTLYFADNGPLCGKCRAVLRKGEHV
ncbi:MAG: hypothetical protein ISS35_04835 [Kiritimatiellae bacterium]|nr:hypothetical protein [Kiritimatiellia bacterium]